MAPRASRRTPLSSGGAGSPRSRGVTDSNPDPNPDPNPVPIPADSGTQPPGPPLVSILDHVVQNVRTVLYATSEATRSARRAQLQWPS